MPSRFDSIWLGLIVGIFVPALTIVMFYYSNFTKVPLEYFIEYSLMMNILPKLVGLCGIPNLGVFFLFLWRNHYKSAKGVMIATVVLLVSVICLKLFI